MELLLVAIITWIVATSPSVTQEYHRQATQQQQVVPVQQQIPVPQVQLPTGYIMINNQTHGKEQRIQLPNGDVMIIQQR